MTAWCESVFGVAPLDPWALAILLAVPAVLLLVRRRGPTSVAFAPFPVLFDGPPPPRTWRVRLRLLPVVLGVLGLVLAVVALARPVFRERLPRTSEGVDILLVLDRSASMTTEDLAVGRTRLAVAKDAAKAFVAGRPFDRIGLLTFARFPDLVCPPTLDHGALVRLLDDVPVVLADGAEDATGVGGAMARAAEFLRTAVGAKIVVLLTDGVENVASAGSPDEIDPVQAGRFAKEFGVRTYVVSAAAGDAPDQAGVATVRRAAERTGGRFFAARDQAALNATFAAIDAAEKTRFEEPRYRLEDRFAPLLAAALLLLLLGRVLGATVFGSTP